MNLSKAVIGLKANYGFIQKHIGLQETEIISTNVNNDIFQVFAAS